MAANKASKSQGSVAGLTVGRAAIAQTLKRVLRDRVAFLGFLILVMLYLMVGFADFIGPYSEQWSDRALANAPPTQVYMISESGGLTWPYVQRYERRFDSENLEYSFLPVEGESYPVQLLAKGENYQFLGLIPTDRHLFGVEKPARIALLGNDMNGRDNFSRLLFGGQISLTIGFLSLFIAFPLGLLYGGFSGYLGGWVDNLMMRLAEVIMSIPSLYLLITLAAIIPSSLTSSQRFTMVVVILAFIGWAGFSRVIRGMVLAIKEQEFVEAGRAIGLNNFTLIVRHILPQTASYLIVALTLSVPGYILMESGLSFLGLGIVQPDASWGNMLKEAQSIPNVLYAPWMLMPGLMIFLAVLAFNVVGDAVRDVLDPKSYIRN